MSQELFRVCFIVGISLFVLIKLIEGGNWIYQKIRERNRLAPEIEELVRRGIISKRPESATVDTTFLARMVSLIDSSDAPEELRNRGNQAYFSGGPLDGLVSVFPPFIHFQQFFLVAVHRRQNRFAVYSQVDESENWEGEGITKVWRFKFDRFTDRKEADEIFRKMLTGQTEG